MIIKIQNHQNLQKITRIHDNLQELILVFNQTHGKYEKHTISA